MFDGTIVANFITFGIEMEEQICWIYETDSFSSDFGSYQHALCTVNATEQHF